MLLNLVCNIVSVKDFKVSEHFSFKELTITHDHPELLSLNRKYFAMEPFISRLTYAAEYLLEFVRDEIHVPIVVTNGGRCPELNAAVKGSEISQHMFSNQYDGAFDFYTYIVPVGKIAEKIWFSGLSFYQMRVYLDHHFIHLGMPRAQNNMQVTFIGGPKPDWAK